MTSIPNARHSSRLPDHPSAKFTRVIYICVISLTLGVTSASITDECPYPSGQEEYNQMKRLWMNELDITSGEHSAATLAHKLALDHLYNVRVMPYDNKPYVVKVTKYKLHKQRRGHMLMITMKETRPRDKSPTSGGSSFRGTMTSSHTKMPCSTRDYFNGTYLMCCAVMQDNSTLRIVHEYQQFTAYELFDRRVFNEIYTKTLTLKNDLTELIRPNQGSCYDVHMGSAAGYWVKDDETGHWDWVVDGCVLSKIPRKELNKCIDETYHSSISAMGDSHARNLWYYFVIYSDPTYVNEREVHRPISYKKHYYLWSTSCMTLYKDLRAFGTSIQDMFGSNPSQRHLLLVDMGVWQMISRPAYDYVTCIELLMPMLRRIQALGIKVVWQNMPSVPKPNFDRGYKVVNTGSFRANYVVGALNYIACHLLSLADVECIPNWLYTYAWRDDLICGGDAHTMCTGKKGRLEVTAPGEVSSQYGMLLACPPEDKEDYVYRKQLQQEQEATGGLEEDREDKLVYVGARDEWERDEF